jgi:hypothetical protein
VCKCVEAYSEYNEHVQEGPSLRILQRVSLQEGDALLMGVCLCVCMSINGVCTYG